MIRRSLCHDCKPCKNGLTEMPFGLWTQVDSRNHVLVGGPDPPYDALFWGDLGVAL